MHIPTSPAADLALLSAALFDPRSESPVDIAQTALVFVADARLEISSFLGLTITATDHVDHSPGRVVLRLALLDEHVDPGDIKTSLRLPRATGGAGPGQMTIQIVLYASTPGAFVDIAADISFLNGRAFDSADLNRHLGLAGEPDITGVIQADTVVGEAVGVLLARGRTHQEAYAELDALCGAAHTDRVTEATGILATLILDGHEDHEP